MVTWETVRAFALSLPESEETGPPEKPSYRVRGKAFAWRSRVQDDATLAIRVDRDEKPLILESQPERYYITPHYASFPAVLVHLDAIGEDELRERIEDAWLIQAPRALAKEFLAAAEDA